MNMVARVYNDIIRTGRVSRGSIGVEWLAPGDRPDLFKALGTNQGVMISKVHPGGPADKGGLKMEDIIIAMNGKPVKRWRRPGGPRVRNPRRHAGRSAVDREGKHMNFKVTIMDRAEVFKDLPQFAELQQNGDDSAPKPAEVGANTSSASSCYALTDDERTDDGHRGAERLGDSQRGRFIRSPRTSVCLNKT